ncbi:15132_t:CDS:2 [Funneliformis caledonium]|uniref:15132_t:CDS:1 n=1 Tax=Funneliformis caledonium TaxID=1117310 RepID=A0A9N8VRB5_9GLOM|nr:15132_t:CDS:2 [Funneliformis caledonium]
MNGSEINTKTKKITSNKNDSNNNTTSATITTNFLSSDMLLTPEKTQLPSPAHTTTTTLKTSPLPHLSEEQRVEIKEVFDLFDNDKKGALCYQELKTAMKALGFDEKKPELLKIIRQYDKSDEGLISYEDFFKFMAERIVNRSPMEEVHRAFQLFDDDNTGKISLQNLKRVAKELGENLDEDELQAMIDEFDLDDDGEISMKEFIKIMTEE